MISKAQIKDLRALHLPKFRQIYNKFIAEGDNACIEFLKSEKYKIQGLYVTNGFEAAYEIYLKDKKVDLISVTAAEMAQISILKTPSPILMLLEQFEESPNLLLNHELCAIYLDGVQDPGNVGTIIRIADWFGVDMVIRSPDSADFFNPKVVQATMGSMVNVHLITAGLENVFIFGRKIYGTFLEGVAVSETNIEKNGILVMGSEGKGISAGNKKYIHECITIPGHSARIAESLNVSVAAGIICAGWKGYL
ncbi:MAG: RNA methyltransferase [Saprospiraceae bacterium]|nr:RNA methyltransferase [Saprospiraceae bacterium]